MGTLISLFVKLVLLPLKLIGPLVRLLTLPLRLLNPGRAVRRLGRGKLLAMAGAGLAGYHLGRQTRED